MTTTQTTDTSTSPPSSPEARDNDTRPLRFIGKTEVMYRTNLSYPTIWKRMLQGTFPRARDNGGKNDWIESEIDDYIANRPIPPLKGEAHAPRSRVGGFADQPTNTLGRKKGDARAQDYAKRQKAVASRQKSAAR